MDTKHTILIVDDSATIRVLAQAFVARLEPSWGCVMADSAMAAMAVLEKQPIDGVLLDLRLPKIDGFAFAKLARAAKPNIYVALLTADASTEVQMRAESARIEFLVKPLTEEKTRRFVDGVKRHFRPL